MHEVVLRDASLMRQAGRFVWLELNFDAPASAAIIDKYAAQSIPALLVVDPESDTVVARWLATATPAQVNDFLDRAVGGGSAGPAGQAMADGERLMGKGQLELAAKAYRRAVDASPAGEPLHASAVAALILALEESGQSEACARSFTELGPALRPDARLVSAAFIAASCLGGAGRAPWGAKLGAAFEPLLDKARRVSDAPFDQRSSIIVALASLRQEHHDEAGARALRTELLELLSTAWKTAAGPQERVALAAFWPWVARSAGRPERALAPLEQCERASPAEYQCSLQLAQAYVQVGRLDDAQRASERGLSKAIGAESRYWIAAVQIDVLIKRGDLEAARRTFEAAVAAVGKSPPDRVQGSIARLRKRLEPPAPAP
jgi:tetratricopeptide (TPR) repeat protein